MALYGYVHPECLDQASRVDRAAAVEKQRRRVVQEQMLAGFDLMLPTARGGMESAHKAICHTRIKRSGAWWVEDSCNEMLRIRCAIYNGTFDRVFDHYMTTQRPSALRLENK